LAGVVASGVVLGFIGSWLRVELGENGLNMWRDGGHRHSGGDSLVGCAIVVLVGCHLGWEVHVFATALLLGLGGGLVAHCSGIEGLEVPFAELLESVSDSGVGSVLGLALFGVEDEDVKDKEELPEESWVRCTRW
jgi:hypothetical protein